MKTKFFYVSIFLISVACQDQLDILNPNAPTPASATTRSGIVSLSQGAVYINGFTEIKSGGDFFSGTLANHEKMGDIIGSPFRPYWLSCPDLITLDDGSTLKSINANGQKQFLKDINVPTNQTNILFGEWAFMYGMNAALNQVLLIVDGVDMTESEKKTIKAWAFFWKGFAYSRVGSMYHAGIINDKGGTTNNHYVTRGEILDEAERNFQLAEELLTSLDGNTDYSHIIDKLIPSVCKRGKGNPLSTEEWIRNINTMRARNLLVNTPVSSADAEFWTQISFLTAAGVQKNDNTFTIRTDELGNLLTSFVAKDTEGPAQQGGGIYKVSERLIQEFDAGDQRLLNNFDSVNAYIADKNRGTAINTRYILVDQGKGIDGTIVYCNKTEGEQEIYVAGTFEENTLMNAEALIYSGQTERGLELIDELRTYQGAGLAPLSGTGRTQSEAKEILRRERRIALAFRGFAFYDARRWGVLENGRSGSIVVDFSGVVNTNAKIDYGYAEYWDVPIAESFLNPPSPDSAPIVNND